ncbi:unnamed protein product [Bursaphelenchus xylophilus]|uniref:(pine wood nematode) hypothetical protein n=1 Tax=Bursaphelenchus xylophilus TaxID=6326 RepID=A0A1I7RUR1_BURXY|nr:unnamed protein product [Bursaphelenchus xylophilus]CAG9114340.1 unnamed protein product [Bursaphelenchus xylophilus]
MSLLAPAHHFTTSQPHYTPPKSNSPTQYTWQDGSLFSPKVQQQREIEAQLVDYIQKQCHVVDSNSPRSRLSNLSSYPQGQLIFDLLAGRAGHSMAPKVSPDLSRPYWSHSNSYVTPIGEPSLKTLAREMESMRTPRHGDFKHSSRSMGPGKTLLGSATSTRSSSGRAPSPNCRVTDDERERMKAEQRLYDKVKTVLCTQYMKIGRCDYGRNCRFAHGYAELRLRKVPANYKTVLCQNFERDGFCRYGKRCQFIHRNGDNAEQGDVDFTQVDDAVVITSESAKKGKYPCIGSFHRSNLR